MSAATWTRRVLVMAGVACMGWWAWLALTSIPAQWWLPWGIWLAGSVALNDAVIAPLVIVLGWLVLVRLPALVRTRSEGRVRASGPANVWAGVALRGAVMVLGTLLLVWLVALWSANR
ncbi:hypothetical protein [Promicromonospora kroppenstedtii]|uniref:hypothetical protein n=1 Tax=Promicromonospora kroppenstedtii TaxID=440482 RepID=UPI0012F884D0|nr:hypothetical protein [Promicromonospora kroppenstedtii]